MPDGSRTGHKVAVRILGIDPAFNRMTALFQLILFERHYKTIGDVDHFLYQVNADHTFRDGMLHLQAGVHFKKVIIQLVVNNEFNGSGAVIITGFCRGYGMGAHLGPHFRGKQGGGGFFHHLLMSALNRALALEKVNGVAVLIGQYLKFNMVRRFNIFFDVNGIIPESCFCFGTGAAECTLNVFLPFYQPHSFSASAGRGFNHHRQTDFPDGFQGFVIIGNHFNGTGYYGHPGGNHGLPRCNLVAHLADGIRARPDKLNALLAATF
ncbi:hypothetical protein DSECCO2_233500 [anaerobic digester metagenome]